MKYLLLTGLFLGLVACSGAEQKPKSQWKVNVRTEGEPKLWVAKADGSRQCGAQAPLLSPEGAADQLKSAGVLVYQYKPGTDGRMHAQRCGAATGNTVDLEISRTDLPKAQAMGFKAKSTQVE